MARKLDSDRFYPTTVHIDDRISSGISEAGYTLKTAVNAALLDFLRDPMTRDRKLAALASFVQSASGQGQRTGQRAKSGPRPVRT